MWRLAYNLDLTPEGLYELCQLDIKLLLRKRRADAEEERIKLNLRRDEARAIMMAMGAKLAEVEKILPMLPMVLDGDDRRDKGAVAEYMELSEEAYADWVAAVNAPHPPPPLRW